jgi:hypothetical protein
LCQLPSKKQAIADNMRTASACALGTQLWAAPDLADTCQMSVLQAEKFLEKWLCNGIEQPVLSYAVKKTRNFNGICADSQA